MRQKRVYYSYDAIEQFKHYHKTLAVPAKAKQPRKGYTRIPLAVYRKLNRLRKEAQPITTPTATRTHEAA